MKTLKNLTPEANQLRITFQRSIVEPFIKQNGSLNGYQRQIYLLLPKFDRRRKLYKNLSKETYTELYKYLLKQSQRIFSKYAFTNDLNEICKFQQNSFNICYKRVWHNGVTSFSGKHWASQIQALLEGVELYGFTYYEDDYNFGTHLYSQAKKMSIPLLINIYKKILKIKLG